VLITGAGGYIGGRLTQAFLAEGHEVRGLVRERAPWLGVDQLVCDLSSEVTAAKLKPVLADVDTVVHLAGENEIATARTPASALSATVVATERLAEACVAAHTRRLLYLSTVHVYGARIVPSVTLTEDMRPEPRSAYGISRLASEHVAASLADATYELVVLRLTNSVGAPYDPRVDRWTLVANDLCRQGAETGRLELRSSGVQWRDFVPLDDVCSALVRASVEHVELPPGTYNLGSGRPRTIRQLAGIIQDAFERQTGRRPALHGPEPAGEHPEPYHVSVQRAAQQGLAVAGRLEDAISETVSFCLEHFR
jgi:UDP-glucose 4-epimerase